MTIIFQGHVATITGGDTPGGVRLTIVPEARRTAAPYTLEAFKGEADAYKVGDQIQVQITPTHTNRTYITPWEEVYVQIANAVGSKGELWNSSDVVHRVKTMVARLEALRIAVGE